MVSRDTTVLSGSEAVVVTTRVSLAGTIGPRHLQQEILRSPPGLLSLQAEEDSREKVRLEKKPGEEVREDMMTGGRGRNKKLGSGSDLSQQEKKGQ